MLSLSFLLWEAGIFKAYFSVIHLSSLIVLQHNISGGFDAAELLWLLQVSRAYTHHPAADAIIQTLI